MKSYRIYYVFVCRCFGASDVLTNWLQRDNVVPSCCNVNLLLEELKTAIQCLGIKPKAINK